MPIFALAKWLQGRHRRKGGNPEAQTITEIFPMALAFFDGNLVEKSSLQIAISDFGFTRGLTIFELARVYGGKVFRLDDHLERLQNGTAFIGLSLPQTIDKIKNDVAHIIAQNKFPHSSIQFFLTAGESQTPSHSFALDQNFAPHLMIIEVKIHPQHPKRPTVWQITCAGKK